MKNENIIVKALKTLFGIYAITIFVLSHIVVIPCYLVIFNIANKKRAPHIAHKISRFWAKLLLTCFFIRADIKGKEYIHPNQVYVFVCNHRSQLDIPLFALACRNTFRFLSKVEVARIPFLGYVVRKLYIVVDRKSKEDRARSMTLMKDSLLKEKISITLYPEGTRNRTEVPLLDFRDGAFRLAIEAQLPVAALTIFNSGDFTPPNKFQLKPGILRAAWCEPIVTVGMTNDDIPKLKELVRNRILEILKTRNDAAQNKSSTV